MPDGIVEARWVPWLTRRFAVSTPLVTAGTWVSANRLAIGIDDFKPVFRCSRAGRSSRRSRTGAKMTSRDGVRGEPCPRPQGMNQDAVVCGEGGTVPARERGYRPLGP